MSQIASDTNVIRNTEEHENTMQQGSNDAQKNCLRHAEKDRVSSCPFADAIAASALLTFRSVCPGEITASLQQNVVAAVVMEIVEKTQHTDGEKATATSPQTAESENSKTEQKQLTAESHNSKKKKNNLHVISLGMGTKFMSSSDILADESHGDCVHDCHAEVLAKKAFQLYLHQQIQWSIATKGKEGIFESDNGSTMMKLKSGILFHFYSSSAPCGNACIKRWGKGSKCVYSQFQGTMDYPCQVHSRIHIVARDKGQVALLVKKDPQSQSSLVPSLQQANLPVIEDMPLGTAPVPSYQGILPTCSDRLAKWNVLGIQGSSLALVIDPIYLTTCTFGRKFSRLHSERALCCRLQDFKPVPISETTKDGDSHFTEVPQISRYYLHHPTMLGTAEKLDLSIKSQADRAMFEEKCFWWLTASSCEEQGKKLCSEILNGKTGKVWNTNQPSLLSKAAFKQVETSTVSLFFNGDVRQQSQDSRMSLSSDGKVEYLLAKQQLLTAASLFKGWPSKSALAKVLMSVEDQKQLSSNALEEALVNSSRKAAH